MNKSFIYRDKLVPWLASTAPRPDASLTQATVREAINCRRSRRRPYAASNDHSFASGHAFISTWKVEDGGDIWFSARGDFTIDWGDGCIEKVSNTGKQSKYISHVYFTGGEHTVSISAGVKELRMTKYRSDETTLIEVKQWGIAQWETMEKMFDGSTHMTVSATDTPDLSKVENMSAMFRECILFNSPIEHWNYRKVKNISGMLSGAASFNQPISSMDLRAVKEIDDMLTHTTAFDQDLKLLKINSKTDTGRMFTNNYLTCSLSHYIKNYTEKHEQSVTGQELDLDSDSDSPNMV